MKKSYLKKTRILLKSTKIVMGSFEIINCRKIWEPKVWGLGVLLALGR